MERKPTMNDVARLARVGTMTVSRVLNGSANVTEETAERVYRAIEKLGYRPNEMARALRSSCAKVRAGLPWWSLGTSAASGNALKRSGCATRKCARSMPSISAAAGGSRSSSIAPQLKHDDHVAASRRPFPNMRWCWRRIATRSTP